MAHHHPIPAAITKDLQQLQNAMAQDMGDDPTESFGDLLRAQWNQLQDFLKERANDELPAVLSATPGENDAADLLQKMQDLIGETIGKHPRLSPLTMPVAEKALQAAAADQQVPDAGFGPNSSLLRHLHNWILT